MVSPCPDREAVSALLLCLLSFLLIFHTPSPPSPFIPSIHLFYFTPVCSDPLFYALLLYQRPKVRNRTRPAAAESAGEWRCLGAGRSRRPWFLLSSGRGGGVGGAEVSASVNPIRTSCLDLSSCSVTTRPSRRTCGPQLETVKGGGVSASTCAAGSRKRDTLAAGVDAQMVCVLEREVLQEPASAFKRR